MLSDKKRADVDFEDWGIVHNIAIYESLYYTQAFSLRQKARILCFQQISKNA